MSKSPTKEIRWRISMSAAPQDVFALISSDKGRETFWADASRETEDGFTLEFVSGENVTCRVIEAKPPESFMFEYFGGSRVEFRLSLTSKGGTDFELIEPDCPDAEWLENHAGWVAWLHCLKGAVDHGITLRNKSADKTWAKRFVDG